MRTVKSLRTWAIRFRPISGVGNEFSANRVDSMPLAARMTAQLGATLRNLALSRDIDLNRVHCATGCVEA